MDGFRGLLADLEALFGAELARQEDEAADDLASSLKADRNLTEVLTEGPFSLIIDGRTIPVESVGRDYVEGVGFIVPLARCRFHASVGERPRSSDLGFLDRLRLLARVRTAAGLGLEDGTLEGTLIGVAPDHLLVGVAAGPAVVPVASVRWVRLSLEDSTGVS